MSQADNKHNQTPYTAIVLAGQRPGNNPLCDEAGVNLKAVIPVGGRPMLLRVVDALRGSGRIDRILISGPHEALLKAAPEMAPTLTEAGVEWIPVGDSPSESALYAFQQVEAGRRCLVTTADHALLTPEIVADFCDKVDRVETDFVVALLAGATLDACYPGLKRTLLRLQDGTYRSCNLFALRTPQAAGVLAFWRRLDARRKTPWRWAVALGPVLLLRYLSGHLTLKEAFDRLSKRVDAHVGMVPLTAPEAGLDVDTPADRALVEAIISGQTGISGVNSQNSG